MHANTMSTRTVVCNPRHVRREVCRRTEADLCVRPCSSRNRKARQNKRHRGVRKRVRTHTHTRSHTHTHKQTCCLLPAPATKWKVPFPLITAVGSGHLSKIQFSGSKRVAVGAASENEQLRARVLIISYFRCSLPHLVIKSHIRPTRRTFFFPPPRIIDLFAEEYAWGFSAEPQQHRYKARGLMCRVDEARKTKVAMRLRTVSLQSKQDWL